jgi:hypothetical protein
LQQRGTTFAAKNEVHKEIVRKYLKALCRHRLSRWGKALLGVPVFGKRTTNQACCSFGQAYREH